MIQIQHIEDPFVRCHSCGASKEKNDTELFGLSVGMTNSDTSTSNLCLTCVFELKLKLSEIR